MPQRSYHNNKWVSVWCILIAGFIGLSGCKPLALSSTASNRIDTSTSDRVDDEVVAMISPYRDDLEESMNAVVANLETDLVKELPEGTLGNHVAEVTYVAAVEATGESVDLAIMNYGGLRVPIVELGPLQVKDAYQIMPFDNIVVVMDLPANVLMEVLHSMASRGGWPVHNMTYVIRNGKAADVTIGGQPIDKDAIYRVAISDYLAEGGDNLSMLKTIPHTKTKVLVREAILDFWKAAEREGSAVTSFKDGRVRMESNE